jgi:hypothetical protein
MNWLQARGRLRAGFHRPHKDADLAPDFRNLVLAAFAETPCPGLRDAGRSRSVSDDEVARRARSFGIIRLLATCHAEFPSAWRINARVVGVFRRGIMESRGATGHEEAAAAKTPANRVVEHAVQRSS